MVCRNVLLHPTGLKPDNVGQESYAIHKYIITDPCTWLRSWEARHSNLYL